MKKITLQIPLFLMVAMSSLISTAQITWNPYEIEVTIPMDQLDSYTIEATSSCPGGVQITWEEDVFSGNCYGNIYRVYTATDDCGNTSTAFQLIALSNTSIVIDPLIQIECSDPIPAPEYALVYPDTMVTVSISESQSSLDCGAIINRTYLVSDACGNEAVFNQEIQIQDNTPPQIHNVIANSAAFCDAIPDPNTVYATDNCDDDVDLSYTETVSGTVCSPIISRFWTAIDNCGNTTEITQTIQIIYNPHFLTNFNPEMTVECSEIPDVPTVTVGGACDDDLEIIFDQTIEPEGCGQLITRTWTADDACGNHLETTQILHVVDTTPPLIFVPADEEITCDDEVPNPGNAIVLDNCDDDIEIVFEESSTNSGGCSQVITRTWTATDDCGNSASASQTITVVAGPSPLPENELITITSVAPNPTSNRSEIEFVSSVDTHAVLEVYDMKGRKIEGLFNQDIEANLPQKVALFVDNLDEGIYFLRLTSNEGQSVQKIIISK